MTGVSSALLVFGAGCSVDNSTLDGAGAAGDAPIVVGAGSTEVGAVVAQLYAGILRTTGVSVSVRDNLGDRADYLDVLDSGEVTVVPDFTGELLTYFEPAATATTPTDVFGELSASLPQGFSVSDFAAAENRSVLVVDQVVARDVHDVDDLASRCATSTLVVGGEFDRTALAGDTLRSVPDCTFAGVADGAADPEVLERLGADRASVGALTTLSGLLGSGNLVALSDDEGAFRAQNVVPLHRSGTLAEAQIKALNVVAGELTSADLADMVDQVREGAESEDVARAWLDAHS
ncbi:glycine betaine ABC transporter substrate-binding protein [Rhodococcus sp. NPDC058521]|uniref:glycine betaine ABC transporter substrate-binding protein n=1 Tax=Rhodococcus sp. NPDC058521 TaxID=3346536 RepID=UPI00366287C6